MPMFVFFFNLKNTLKMTIKERFHCYHLEGIHSNTLFNLFVNSHKGLKERL